MKQMLGVLGGMGAFASELFYKMITEKTITEKDQDHIKLLLFSDTQMPDRTAAILSGEIDSVCNQMLYDCKLLENAGCNAIAITCNTAHFFADMVSPKLSIPIIHMIKETAKVAKKSCKDKKIAILATDGTIKTQLYQKALFEKEALPYVPSKETQAKIMYLIYDCVKSGKPVDMNIWNQIEEELLHTDCGKALLACTELSCIKAEKQLSEYYIDPMEVLADSCIQFMGKEIKTI